MEKLNKQYGDKVDIFGINIGVSERLERVEKFIKEKRIKLEIVFDEAKTFMKIFKVATVPTTIVIDTNGRISYRREVTSENVEETLDNLLKGKSE